MEYLLAAIVLAVLLLPAGMLREMRSSLGSSESLTWLEPAEDLDGASAGIDQPGVDDGLFTLPFVRHRLDLLANEIAHLDDDEGVMARAFRRTVALTAYESLLADETRLAQAPTLYVDAALGFEMMDEPIGPHQEWAR